jgi:hypothetical protein
MLIITTHRDVSIIKTNFLNNTDNKMKNRITRMNNTMRNNKITLMIIRIDIMIRGLLQRIRTIIDIHKVNIATGDSHIQMITMETRGRMSKGGKEARKISSRGILNREMEARRGKVYQSKI